MRTGAWNPGKFAMGLLALMGILVSGIFFGLLAVTANPLFIAMGLGLVGGAVFLARPKWIIVILFSVTMVMGALISFAGQAFDKLPWAMSLLGFLLLAPVVLSTFRVNKPAKPFFIWLAIAFLGYAVLVTTFQWNSVAEAIAGFKRYFQAYGLLLGLAFLPLVKKDFISWQRIWLTIALLQFPFALYELLVLVPKRGGLSSASYTTDVVAGTFGANLEGGSPAIIMVIFLLVTFSFIFSRWRNGLIPGPRAFALSLVVLMPLGMGESKVALLMLPLVWLVLVRHDIARAPIKYFPVLLGGGLLTALLGYIYVALIMKSTLSEVVEATISYNFADAGYAEFYLNRTTVLSFWFDKQGLNDPVSFFFGNGLGSAFFGQISGHIGILYPRHGIDLTAASTLLWDLGMLGLLLFVMIFVAAWHTAKKLYHEAADPLVRADALAIQAAISLFMIQILYAQDIINLIASEVLYSAVLGYLAYLYAVHQQNKKISS